jgi:hypothetical protein
MPRPKRTKVASVVPLNKANKPVEAQVKKPVSKPSAKSKDVIIGKKTRQNPRIRPTSSTPDEFKMSGALPLSDTPQETTSRRNRGSVPRSSVRNARDTRLVQKSKISSKGNKNDAIEPEQPTEKQRERTPQAEHSTDSDLYGLSPSGELSRAKIEAQQASRRASLMQPQSAIKAISTPAVETSILALNKFKRRPRQPSIIRQMQEASELGTNFDNFDDFDLDDFNPEDESTPLHIKNGATQRGEAEQHTSSSRKRKHSEMIEPAQISSSSLSSPLPSSPSALPQEDDLPSVGGDVEPERFSDTMAPPLSSSSDISPPRPLQIPQSKSTKRIGDNTQKRRRVTQISTNVLQSFLPRQGARRSRRQNARQTEFDLSASSDIPSDDIIEINSDPSELSQDSPPTRRDRRAEPPVKAVKPSVGSRQNTTKQTKRKVLAEKNTSQKSSNLPQKISDLGTKGKPKRTYGRRKTEDKENNDNSYLPGSNHDVDESTVIEQVLQSKELVKIRDKFAEVDAWEMEYESVDIGGSSSSPWR